MQDLKRQTLAAMALRALLADMAPVAFAQQAGTPTAKPDMGMMRSGDPGADNLDEGELQSHDGAPADEAGRTRGAGNWKISLIAGAGGLGQAPVWTAEGIRTVLNDYRCESHGPSQNSI